jgi:HAE1 family hydrophobic/amphiphilic exporter-1
MLVDNAIVVVENIIRHRQEGEGPVESAIKGTQEVAASVTGSTCTNIVVFLPMFYIKAGRMSVFMEQFGYPLVIGNIAALLVALTLVPLAMSRLKDSGHANIFERLGIGHTKETAGGSRFMAKLSWLYQYEPIGLVERLFKNLVTLSLRHRLAALLVMMAFGAVTYYIPYANTQMRDLPDMDTREIKIDVSLEQNYDMNMAKQLFAQLEDEVNKMRDELGIRNMLTFYERSGGVLDVYLYNPDDDHPYALNPPFVTIDVMRILSKRLPEKVPGAKLAFTITDTSASGGQSVVGLRMEGDDTTLLEEYSNTLMSIVKNVPNVTDVKLDTLDEQVEMQLHVDDALAAQRGVSTEAVATTVQTALRGSRLPFLKEGSREVPVWAQYREEDRQSMANLDNVKVMNAKGELVSVRELIDYDKAPSQAQIQRVDGKNVINLSANANTEDLGQIKRDLQNITQQLDLPMGYEVELGDNLAELDANVFSFTTTLLMALILIYIVMGSLFESYLYPLSILTSVPLSLMGAVWALWATNSPMDSITLIGCIFMAGIIVSNGIVIVDFMITLRNQGMERNEAIITASEHRFRPVMMTALTAVLGLIPLAMATTGGAATFAGLGRALIGGLTIGTLLTLLVVPLFFTFFDDIQIWCKNYVGNLITRGKLEGSE